MTNEFDIIKRYFAPLSATAPGAFTLGDDACVLKPAAGQEFVMTTDTVVQGVHYLADAAPTDIVAKLVGSNLSDLAAMGAKPEGFTLSCAWSKTTSEADIAAFAAALKTWVDDYAFPLLGGDTVALEGPEVFTLTAVGAVPDGKALRRAGAKAGQKIYVTGTIGDGALGLLTAQGTLTLGTPHADFLSDRYRRPQPRIATGQKLVGIASACLDISDGLVQDAGHIAEQSMVDLVIHADKVPLSDAARAVLLSDPARLTDILTGGDDYELLFCADAPPTDMTDTVTEIGDVIAGLGKVRVVDANGATLRIARSGFTHL